jgi:large subunit ribosomal protein L10
MLKEQKEQVVAELVERLKASDTLFVADYRGLDMPAIDEVRTELLKHGARFSVVKNTLTKRAAEEAGVPDLVELLDGPTAIAFVGDGDMVAVAKTLSDSAKQTKILALKGGILEGKPMTAEEIQRLAALPSAELLRGQVLGAIVAPLTAIAGLVNAPLQNLHGLLDARIEQLREQGDTSDAEAATPEDPPAEEADAPAAEAEAPEPEAEAEAETDAAEEPETADEAAETPDEITEETENEEE